MPKWSRAQNSVCAWRSQMANVNMPRSLSSIALPPLLVAVQQDLGIRAGGEGVPGGLQLFAQGLEVVDFAVEHDDEAAVLVIHRLAAALQVDDGQAALPPARPGLPETGPGRPARGGAMRSIIACKISAAFSRAPTKPTIPHISDSFSCLLCAVRAQFCAAGAEFFGVAFYLIFPYYTQFRRHCKAPAA